MPCTNGRRGRFGCGHWHRNGGEDARAGVQYCAEVMDDCAAYTAALPAGHPAESEVRDLVTLRIEQLARRQALRLSLFVFYSPADADYLVQPVAEYKLSDELRLSVGANVFGGDAHTMLGRFDRSDNVHATARFDFRRCRHLATRRRRGPCGHLALRPALPGGVPSHSIAVMCGSR